MYCSASAVIRITAQRGFVFAGVERRKRLFLNFLFKRQLQVVGAKDCLGMHHSGVMLNIGILSIQPKNFPIIRRNK